VVDRAREREQRDDEAFREAVRQVERGEPEAARRVFHELAVANPQNRRYRAYLHYARGRERLATGHADSARSELKRALTLQPQFEAAERALEEASSRRSGKPFFKKLFGK
jgi:hypothetical protein